MCSIKSGFQFINYKVDSINLKMNNTVGMLASVTNRDEDWKFKYGISQPLYITEDDIYISSTSVTAFLGDEIRPHLKLDTSVSGIFKYFGSDKPKDIDSFVKIQMPAILSPYLRSAITYILAMAGFGQVIPPLVNFRQMANELLKDKHILIQKDGKILGNNDN